MIPSDTNPFGLESKNLKFHVIELNDEIETLETKNRKYRYATFPSELVSKYGKEWALESGEDMESYEKLEKYVSREETSGNKFMVYSN